MKNGLLQTATYFMLVFIVVIATLVFAISSFGDILSSMPQGHLYFPCEQVTQITEKHTKITSSGQFEYWVTTSGGAKAFIIDIFEGKSKWEQIPMNTDLLLQGGTNARGNIFINNYQILKNVSRVTNTDCINCCSGEMV